MRATRRGACRSCLVLGRLAVHLLDGRERNGARQKIDGGAQFGGDVDEALLLRPFEDASKGLLNFIDLGLWNATAWHGNRSASDRGRCQKDGLAMVA